MAPATPPLNYRDAGVDIEAGDALVESIKPIAKQTWREGVVAGLGGFGALFQLPGRFREPLLVAGTDGVGTKLKLACELNRHATIGIDLVAMCANDVVVQGAEPLFFLDYFATGLLAPEVAKAVIGGIGAGCQQAGAALIGGETAEMPGMYPTGEYDLAGFCVGAVEKSLLIDGHAVQPGDAVIGLASSGPHANGYSLIRKIIETRGVRLDDEFQGQTIGDRLLRPTRIYVKPVLAAIESLEVRAIAHITGGGLAANIARVLPVGAGVALRRSAWIQPQIFDWIQDHGDIAEGEMLRTFNCGLGMILIVPAIAVGRALKHFETQEVPAWVVGQVLNRNADPVLIHD